MAGCCTRLLGADGRTSWSFFGKASAPTSPIPCMLPSPAARAWVRKYSDLSGYHLVATRTVRAGELLIDESRIISAHAPLSCSQRGWASASLAAFCESTAATQARVLGMYAGDPHAPEFAAADDDAALEVAGCAELPWRINHRRISDAQLRQVCRIFQLNAYGAAGSTTAASSAIASSTTASSTAGLYEVGLYEIGCTMSHACDSNVRVTPGHGGAPRGRFIATREIRMGEALTTNYSSRYRPAGYTTRAGYERVEPAAHHKCAEEVVAGDGFAEDPAAKPEKAATVEQAVSGKAAAPAEAAPATVPALGAPPKLAKRQALHAKVVAEGRRTSPAWWAAPGVAATVAEQLATRHYCILDGFLDPAACETLRAEVIAARGAGQLSAAAVGAGKMFAHDAESQQATLRSDQIGWFTGNEPGWHMLPAFLQTVDHFFGGVRESGVSAAADLRGCLSRSRAMVACYTNGARYAKHFDNVCHAGSGDGCNGRRLTASA